ncbi:Uncharacterized protein TSPI_03501 [Trichinella spiralis]|uniref:THAP4-like heme-binding domain-containing protein n=1 Tax=Trichinella spiralis TaxID=6334 RepID=A0ABR3KRH9_TRISP
MSNLTAVRFHPNHHFHLFFLFSCSVQGVLLIFAAKKDPLEKLNWIKGIWRAEYSGKVFWPTIPTMTFGEELVIQDAPVSKASGIRFFNFSARAWSHTTRDHLHDEWGFLTVDPTGKAVLMTTGNNVSFSRDLPVKELERTFTLKKPKQLEQRQRMRTATHPSHGLLDHAIVIYEKIE